MLLLDTKYITLGNNKISIINKYQNLAKDIIKKIKNNTAKGIEMFGWFNYTRKYTNFDFNQMLKIKNKWLKENICDVVVIGIGGSYLGIKACVDMLYNFQAKQKLNIFFVYNFHNNFLLNLLNKLKNKKFAIIIVSKSGNTLETSIAFDLFKNALIQNFGAKAHEYILAITDKQKGTLHNLVVKYKWSNFVIPNNVGGRYSALTSCGMFLFTLLGLDYKMIIKGANDACKELFTDNLKTNSAFKYACLRHYFNIKKHKQIENFIVYDPNLKMIGEVWKQLFGESEGKEGKALYPTISLFTTDLHSLGQYLQDGTRNFFETTLYVKQPILDINLSIKNNEANLQYLNNKKLSNLNDIAMLSTIKAHFIEGKVDNVIIYLDQQNEYHFGYLYTWLCFAAMYSAYLHNLNPFDQPGVEIYKNRITNILKKGK